MKDCAWLELDGYGELNDMLLFVGVAVTATPVVCIAVT